MGTTRARAERCAERRTLAGRFATGRHRPDPRCKSETAPDGSRLCWRASGSIREYQSDQPSLLACSDLARVVSKLQNGGRNRT
jgi:hypothetical protein